MILQKNRDSGDERQRILREMVDTVTEQVRDTYFARSIPKSQVNEEGVIPSEILKNVGDFQIHFRDQPDVMHPQINGATKKDSYFGIDTEERVEKFLTKFLRTIQKVIYGERCAKDESSMNESRQSIVPPQS